MTDEDALDIIGEKLFSVGLCSSHTNAERQDALKHIVRRLQDVAKPRYFSTITEDLSKADEEALETVARYAEGESPSPLDVALAHLRARLEKK